MSDPNPPSGFTWGAGEPPKKPGAEDAGAVSPEQPVQPPVEPVVQPATKYPAPPPAGAVASATAPPVAPTAPPAASWDQPTQAYTYKAPPAPLVDPAPTPSPAEWDQPTQAYDFRAPVEQSPTSSIYDQLTQPYSFDSSISGATEVLGAQPVGLPELRDEGVRPADPASAIDSLFGDSQFKEYEDSAFPAEASGSPAPARPREAREPMGRTQKILLLAVGGLLVALALVAVFMLGTRSPGILPQPEAEPDVVEEAPNPVAAAPVVGPIAAGTHAWNELLGTECIEPFGSVWDEEFTVVDCATPHTAQMISRGIFGDEAYADYPEEGELQARINLLCTSPASVNYAAAGALSDIAVSASYPASAEEWDAGEREYFCFLTRSTGEPLVVSLANAPVADVGPVASIPGNDP